MTAGSAHGGTVADANPSSTKSPFRTLDDADLRDKRVLLRVDLNAPMQDGKVSDVTRIERMAPTIAEIADKGGKVILLSHLGRPKGPDPKESLRPVALKLRASSSVRWASSMNASARRRKPRSTR